MELDEMRTTRIVAAVAAAAVGAVVLTAAGVATQTRDRGIVLLAHGGSASWNATVNDLRARADERVSTEVALGMATRAAIQSAVDRLIERGVRDIVAVPLFVSSHSSVIEATAYLLGARTDAPPDLALFARMNHGPRPAAGAAADHDPPTPPADGTRPVQSSVPIRMGKALDDHPIVADILVSRARAISREPAREAVVLVAHGPVPDADNALWLEDMRRLAGRVREAVPFAQVEAMTVRDDAPAPVRAAATAELRALVARLSTGGTRVLVVPLLLSYGGIEAGIRKRLEGLAYTMASQGIMPDERVLQWVLEAAGEAPASVK
jgi:sirohydrochlorin ferrochelatase